VTAADAGPINSSPPAAAAPAAPGPAGITPGSAPPPLLPLTFIAGAGLGLIAFGVSALAVRDTVVRIPDAPTVLAGAHVCMLGVLVTALFGALHQFVPVACARPLRSVRAGWVTAAAWLPAVAVLPAGFATGHALLVSGAGMGAFGALCLAGWNLSGPVSVPDRGTPVTGLRWAVTFLVATAAFGVVYAFDRTGNWFLLLPTRVLAHAHLGLIGAVGLAYVAVAEKLWPMFLLAHRPGRSPADWAVRLIPVGVGLLVPGLLFRVAPLAQLGGAVVAAGLACHGWSLVRTISARRRRLELLHAFILASTAFLLAAAMVAALAGFAPVSPLWRMRLVAAEIAALAAWLGPAVIGHAHKIVPFMAYSQLRARGGHRGPTGRPLLFSDLYNHTAARATYLAATAGFAALTTGLIAATSGLVGAGGILLAIAGITATANLAAGPAWAAHLAGRQA
jgi:hypothetical protein